MLTLLFSLSQALDAAHGMEFLHKRQTPILHADLKSSDLLLDANWTVKISEFRLSRLLEKKKHSNDAAM